MIDLIFDYMGELVFVRIKGYSLTFSSSRSLGRYADISGIKLNKETTLKEFPDLVGEENWKELAISRFKENLKRMKNEKEVEEYVKTELKKLGYIPKYRQKIGHRREKL